jgi:hypothetical protein
MGCRGALPRCAKRDKSDSSIAYAIEASKLFHLGMRHAAVMRALSPNLPCGFAATLACAAASSLRKIRGVLLGVIRECSGRSIICVTKKSKMFHFGMFHRPSCPSFRASHEPGLTPDLHRAPRAGSPVPPTRSERTELMSSEFPGSEWPNRGTTQHHTETEIAVAGVGVKPGADRTAREGTMTVPTTAPHDAQNTTVS